MLDSPENRELVLKYFPNLGNDVNFKISSKETPNYNCIAWAAKYDNEWWQPGPPFPNIEGIKYKWPFGAPKDMTLRSLIFVFENRHFGIECKNCKYEEGFIKVALYVKSDPVNDALALLDREWTHAARQHTSGLWTSKLGYSFDIWHSDPYVIEGPRYGRVAIILKQKL